MAVVVIVEPQVSHVQCFHLKEKDMRKGNRHQRVPSEEVVHPTPDELLKKYIVDVPNFPQQGVIFRDITPLLRHATMFRHAMELIANKHKHKDIELVVALEARGFIFAPVALLIGAGFIPVRKEGKLPRVAYAREYNLEYGKAVIEMHRDAIQPGQKVLIVDDVLATGGTARAAVELVRDLGGEPVAADFLIELDFLKGREKLDIPVNSLIHY